MKITFMFITFLVMSQVMADPKVQNLDLSPAEQRILKVEALEHWKKRANQENLEEALSKFDLIIAANPTDLEILVYLTRGHYLMADGHLDDPDLKKRHFEKGVEFGKRALATNPAFKSKNDDKDLEDCVDVLTEKEVPAMYWTAANLGKWAKAEGFFTQIKQKDKIKALIKRVATLKPDYFYGAVPRFWGGFYALAPSIAGGDMDKSKDEFEQSLKVAPEYLGTSVLMAEVYWTKKDDKKAFENLLHTVLLSNQDKHPDIGPENMLEKRKAEKLLERKDELF